MIPQFSVSEFTTWHLTFEEDLALYQKLGVSGIEVCERKLSHDRGKALEQLSMLHDFGLTITSVQPRVHALFEDYMCPDVADPTERMARFRSTIDLFADAFPGQSIPLVTITGKAPTLNYRAAHATARKLYPPLADYAANRGLRIMFEPLHPILMNSDTFICTLKDAMQLIDDVGRDNFGLALDVFHVWNEPNIYQRLRDVSRCVFGVHISDWPQHEPRCPGDRIIPGDGAIDLRGIFGALADGGYGGAYALEIFSDDSLPDSLWKADPSSVIARSRTAFEKIWSERRCV